MSVRWFDPWAELARIRAAIPARVAIAQTDPTLNRVIASRSDAIATASCKVPIATDRKADSGATHCEVGTIAGFAEIATDATQASNGRAARDEAAAKRIWDTLDALPVSPAGKVQRLTEAMRAFVVGQHFRKELALGWR